MDTIMNSVRSLDIFQVQRYEGYRQAILDAVKEGEPDNNGFLRGDEVVVTRPIPVAVPHADPGQGNISGVACARERAFVPTGTTIMPGTHIHREARQGDEIQLTHEEREYMPTTPVPGLEVLDEEWYVARTIGIIFPRYRVQHHKETLTQKPQGPFTPPVLKREVELDQWPISHCVTLTYDLATGEMLHYEGPEHAMI